MYHVSLFNNETTSVKLDVEFTLPESFNLSNVLYYRHNFNFELLKKGDILQRYIEIYRYTATDIDISLTHWILFTIGKRDFVGVISKSFITTFNLTIN